MPSETRVECSLNTTECIFETIASILSEIQDQNSEYNWDPLTFVFTAIIGVIALVFSALAVLQALLAAGPGRTRCGASAIGPWSRQNKRKFDWVDMRFQTTSYTPILTPDSFKRDNLDDKPGMIWVRSSNQDAKTLRKGHSDDFPATWLALLTGLCLDDVDLWRTKSIEADYIPAEFSTVQAYGSIRFVIILSIIYARGIGRLTFDRESLLPRFQAQNFDLIFRQHPLLGTVGFFEMYDKLLNEGNSKFRNEIPGRLHHVDGHNVLEDEPEFPRRMTVVRRRGKRTLFRYSLSTKFANKVRQGCSHGNQEPRSACCKLLDRFADYQPNLDEDGPLRLLTADPLKPKLVPFFFPYRASKLREKLDTLLLQSRFWAMESSAYGELSPDQSTEFVKDELFLARTATSWAESTIGPALHKLKLKQEPYAICSAFLAGSTGIEGESREEFIEVQGKLLDELESVDLWLKQAGSLVLCRELILIVIGNGIQQMIHGAKQEPNIATVQLISTKLQSKLCRFLDAMGKPNSHNYLYPLGPIAKREDATSARQETLKYLTEMRETWEMKESSLEDRGGESGERLDRDQQHKRSWRLPNVAQHPLDDLLIYRAVMVTLLYSLSIDSSDLLDDSYGLVVPIK